MLRVVPVQNITVGDVLAEGLVLSVDKSSKDLIIFHTPMGDVRANPRSKTVRLAKLDQRTVNQYIRMMGVQRCR